MQAVTELGWALHLVPVNGDSLTTRDRDLTDFDLIIFVANHVTDELLQQLEVLGTNPALRILTVARDSDAQTVADTLRAGSDDYLRAPFAVEELVARMQALVSFSPSSTAQLPEERQLIFDVSTRTIEFGSQRVTFSPAEWAVLLVLLEGGDRPVSPEDLAGAITVGRVGSASIPSIISRIRRRLRGANFDLIAIETVHRQGYALRYTRGHGGGVIPVKAHLTPHRSTV